MNAESTHVTERIPQGTPLNIRRRHGLSFVILLLLGIGLGLVEVAARADFTGPYALTPPDPGSYLMSSLTSQQQFAGWTAPTPGKLLIVNTLAAPGSLVLDTGGGLQPETCYFYAHAAAAGTVSFDYTIAGSMSGSFAWFNARQNNPENGGSIAVIYDLVSTPASGSIPVQAGDTFGFRITEDGGPIGPDFARRVVTIENFSAPVPEPSTVTLISCVAGLLAWKAWSRGRKHL